MLYMFNFLRKNAVRAELAYEAILVGLFISPRSLAPDSAVGHTSTQNRNPEFSLFNSTLYSCPWCTLFHHGVLFLRGVSPRTPR